MLPSGAIVAGAGSDPGSRRSPGRCSTASARTSTSKPSALRAARWRPSTPMPLDLGHLDQHRALGDDELDRVALEQRAAARGPGRSRRPRRPCRCTPRCAVDLEAALLQRPAGARRRPCRSSRATLTGCGPLLTTRSTAAPRRSWCRPWGRLAITMPLATVSEYAVRRRRRRSGWRPGRASCAWSSVMPAQRRARRSRSGPSETHRRSTVPPSRTVAPPPGSVLITEPAGTVSE